MPETWEFTAQPGAYPNEGTIQVWTVPYTGSYRIRALGASGGEYDNIKRGADITGDFNLTAGEVIQILVGQYASVVYPHGAGGTFVYRNATDPLPLLVAGGSGGSYNARYLPGDQGDGHGGTTSNGAGPGGGWLSDGSGSIGGKAPRNGGGGGYYAASRRGGFGGGGAPNGNDWPGGGGGFTGGNTSSSVGWGGTSYNSGSNQVNQLRDTTAAAHGQVLVELVSAPPYAPTLGVPATGQVLDRLVTQRFTWTHNDPNTGDLQSAYQWRYRQVGTTAWTSTGWVTSTLSWRDVPAGTFTDGDWEWQVATKDSSGLESPWSSTGFFTAATPQPGPTITDPVNGGTVPTEDYTVVWSTPDQDAYQLQVLDGETVLFDTGQVNTATARSRAVTFPDNQVTRSIRVRVLFGGLWSPWSTVTVTVSYTQPAVPWVTATPVDVGAGALSAIRVDVEDPRLRVDARNLVTNPAGRATSGTVVVRENLAINPSAESDNGWRINNGATHSATWDVSVSHSGTRSRRVEVIASAIDSLSLYAVGTTDVRTSVAGEQPYTFSVYLRAGQADYRGRVSIIWYDSANASLGVTEGVLQDTPEGQWIRCSVSGVAPAGAVSCYPSAFIRKATGNAAIGDFGHADDALFEKTSVLSPYFDGSTSPDPDLTPVWTGTPDASTSQLVGQAPVGWTDAYYSLTSDRVAALSGGATFTLPTDPGASTLVVETETGTLRTPHTGTVVTVTEPYFRAAVVPGTYTGPYFDGDTPADDTYTYRWTGTPDASTSERLAYGTTGELAESTEPMVVAHDVWVRGGPEGEIRLAADLPASLPYLWHLPASGVEYEFRARAVGDNGTSSFSEWVA